MATKYMGNPYKEDQLTLDSHGVMDESVVNTVCTNEGLIQQISQVGDC